MNFRRFQYWHFAGCTLPRGPERWEVWRPTIGLARQDDLPIDELHIIFNQEFSRLAERIRDDVMCVSPNTKVVLDIIQLANPWDFEEVCRASDTAAAAAKRLFAVSRTAKKSSNDSDRLGKHLARFGLKFRDLH